MITIVQFLDVICMVGILCCLFTRPSFLSFFVLTFLFMYIILSPYPWNSVARFIVLPIIAILLLQYIGGFPSISRLSFTAQAVLQTMGISPVEKFNPANETMLLFSEEAKEQFQFNVKEMAGMMSIAVLCIIINWIDVQRVSDAYLLVKRFGKFVRTTTGRWISVDDKKPLDEIQKEKLEIMDHLVNTVSANLRGEVPVSSESIRDSTTSEVDLAEIEREIDNPSPRENEVAAASRKIHSLDKERNRICRLAKIRSAFRKICRKVSVLWEKMAGLIQSSFSTILQFCVIILLVIGCMYFADPSI